MVTIRGVHAPVDCESCPFRSIVYCEPSLGGSIPQGCPVKEVPTPHGRLIDADKIPERYAEVRDLAPTVIEAENMRCDDERRIKEADWI